MGNAPPEPGHRRAIRETGLFGAESLFVRFDFTRSAMDAAARRHLEGRAAGRPMEMPSEVKTYVHELTHYIHYTTTPYGLFLQYCRVLQSRATMAIVQALSEAGLPFDMPLLANVPAMEGKTKDFVQWHLNLWVNVENLVSMLHGERDLSSPFWQLVLADADRIAAGQRPRLPPLLDLQQVFVRVQESMADMLEQINAAARAAGNPVPMEPEGFDREAIRQEMAERPTDRDRADERSNMALEFFGGNPWGIGAIVESAAVAAELWGSDMEYDRFVAWANADVDPKLLIYRSCIAQGLSAIQTRQMWEFIPSYMALCELALYAPLLPHHARLRREYPGFRQILPTQRWAELIQAASHVPPMRDGSHHARYVTDICRALGWVHPFQIIKVAVDGPDLVSNPLAMIYLWAQQCRARSLGSFLGLDRFLFDPSPEGDEWRDRFNFVILEYADRTNYHRDKGFLQAMTTRRLNMLGMRCIMLGKGLTIAAPYRGNPDERRWMTAWLRERFKAVFGRDFPQLKVV